MAVWQPHELSRIAARHGALDARALPGCWRLGGLDHRHVTVAAALEPDGRPAWSRVLGEPTDREEEARDAGWRGRSGSAVAEPSARDRPSPGA